MFVIVCLCVFLARSQRSDRREERQEVRTAQRAGVRRRVQRAETRIPVPRVGASGRL